MFNKLFSVSDQLLLTFWSLLLTFIFANIFSKDHFVVFSLFYVVQSISLLIVNSTFGQMLILEGKDYRFKSVLNKIVTFSLIILGILVILFVSDIIELRALSIRDKILFSTSISLFCFFELLRRYLYSLNKYTVALKGVLTLIILLLISLVVLYFNGLLNISYFFILNSLIYLIAVFYLIGSILKIEENKEKKEITFKEIYTFSGWLFLGVLAYIISDKLFIFYLNSINETDQVIGYRLIETIFGLVLVFVAALENFYISKIQEKKLLNVLKYIKKSWLAFIICLMLIVPVLNFMLSNLFNYHTIIDIKLLLLILFAYEFFILSRAFVVYLRVNKFNKSIFYANLFSSFIVILVFILKIELDLYKIFLLKATFPVTNIIIYLIPYFKSEKTNFNISRFWSR